MPHSIPFGKDEIFFFSFKKKVCKNALDEEKKIIERF